MTGTGVWLRMLRGEGEFMARAAPTILWCAPRRARGLAHAYDIGGPPVVSIDMIGYPAVCGFQPLGWVHEKPLRRHCRRCEARLKQKGTP